MVVNILDIPKIVVVSFKDESHLEEEDDLEEDQDIDEAVVEQQWDQEIDEMIVEQQVE